MNLSEEVLNKARNNARRGNKESLFLSICLMIFGIIIIIFPKENVFQTVFMLVLGALFLSFTRRFYKSTQINLEEESLREWIVSLPSFLSLVKEIELMINNNWKGEMKTFYLKDYDIVEKNKERYLTFIHNQEKISLPLSKVTYDSGEKRVEYYISDRDWTINIRKGTWIAPKIYNL